MGWMVPLCIATGNTMVLKASKYYSYDKLQACRAFVEAGLPKGVLNIVTSSRNEAEILLSHPDVKGISFVGSTSVGLHVYSTGAAHGKEYRSIMRGKKPCIGTGRLCT